eukprot:759179-Hanusia_phi.AAC.4
MRRADSRVDPAEKLFDALDPLRDHRRGRKVEVLVVCQVEMAYCRPASESPVSRVCRSPAGALTGSCCSGGSLVSGSARTERAVALGGRCPPRRAR